MLKRVVMSIALLAAALACGGESSTEPKTDVSGEWTYNATNLSGTGVACTNLEISMTLSQNGTTFSGTVLTASMSCFDPGHVLTGPPIVAGVTAVANGKLSGNRVQFDLGTQDVHNAGSLTGNSMSGTIMLRAPAGSTTVTLTGNFTAVRQ